MRSTILGLTLAVLGAPASWADEPKDTGRIAAGDYVEIDPAGRPNGDFTLTVQEVTPNIMLLRGKNGWVTVASFDADKKEYRGAFEFPTFPGGQRPGGKWADLYHVRVAVQDGVVRIEGKSKDNDFLIRARPGGDVPR